MKLQYESLGGGGCAEFKSMEENWIPSCSALASMSSMLALSTVMVVLLLFGLCDVYSYIAFIFENIYITFLLQNTVFL